MNNKTGYKELGDSATLGTKEIALTHWALCKIAKAMKVKLVISNLADYIKDNKPQTDNEIIKGIKYEKQNG